MVCPPVPAILNLDQSDQEQDESETDDSGDLDEAEDTRSACRLSIRAMQCHFAVQHCIAGMSCVVMIHNQQMTVHGRTKGRSLAHKAAKVVLWCRGAWESSGEVRDQVSKQRQMMADGNLRGFWSKQGRFRLKKYAHRPCFTIFSSFIA